MRDNVGENKSQEIIEFFESMGVKNYFSTANEQWQNGLAEAAINSIMMISGTVVVESGLGGRFWFKSALAAIDACNATYKNESALLLGGGCTVRGCGGEWHARGPGAGGGCIVIDQTEYEPELDWIGTMDFPSYLLSSSGCWMTIQSCVRSITNVC